MNIFKKRKKTEEINPTYRFDSIMYTVNTMLQYAQSSEDKINVLDYANFVVKNQLKGQLMTYCFNYPQNEGANHIIPLPFPVFDETGNKVEYETASTKVIYLESDIVFACPREVYRLQIVLKKIFDRGFIKLDNHRANYYTEMDFSIVMSGCHSISSGIFYKDGIIDARICHTELLFPHVSTDGIFWYKAHNNAVLGHVDDFRIAALYEIAKMKHRFICDDKYPQMTLY